MRSGQVQLEMPEREMGPGSGRPSPLLLPACLGQGGGQEPERIEAVPALFGEWGKIMPSLPVNVGVPSGNFSPAPLSPIAGTGALCSGG